MPQKVKIQKTEHLSPFKANPHFVYTANFPNEILSKKKTFALAFAKHKKFYLLQIEEKLIVFLFVGLFFLGGKHTSSESAQFITKLRVMYKFEHEVFFVKKWQQRIWQKNEEGEVEKGNCMVMSSLRCSFMLKC